jgi:hypothetical protein
MGIMITERDAKLLTLTLQHGVLSFEQVRRYCFPNASSPTIFNRLSRLKCAGLLHSVRVGTVVYHGSPKIIGVVYRATRETEKFARRWLPDETFMPTLTRLNTSTLHHDLLVVDVIHALQIRFAWCRVLNSRTAKHFGIDPKRVPDAVIQETNDSSRVAIELELTTKSKERYREIILEYRMSSVFSKVLYVTNSKRLIEDLKVLMTHKPVLGLPLPSTGKFFFVDLNELLSNPTTALISNDSPEALIKPNPKVNVWDESKQQIG